MLQALEKEMSPMDRVITIEPTSRVERLREAFLDLKPTVSIDRARIEARVMKETTGEPMITRRAKVFAAIAREMPGRRRSPLQQHADGGDGCGRCR